MIEELFRVAMSLDPAGARVAREGDDLIEELFRAPHRFDFFQAVRLLEFLEREGSPSDPSGRRRPVGHDDPLREVATFRAQPSLAFPTAAIHRVRKVDDPTARGGPSPPELTVTFFGLVGPSGVLPRHYTELLIRRERLRDDSLKDFLDLFHHRLISLFYRAWEKYRLPIGYERYRLDDPGGEPDQVTRGLFSLVGMGTPGLRGRLDVDDEVFLHYSGHFAHEPRSAIAMESLLEDHVGTPVRVLQAQGQWLELSVDDQARMPDASAPLGRNNRLGVDFVVGERVWDVQGRFRLRLGPLTWPQFRSLMPSGPAFRPLAQLARAFAGPELDFDVQPILETKEIQPSLLSPSPEEGPNLGWSSWLGRPPGDHPVEDAIFEVEDF